MGYSVVGLDRQHLNVGWPVQPSTASLRRNSVTVATLPDRSAKWASRTASAPACPWRPSNAAAAPASLEVGDLHGDRPVPERRHPIGRPSERAHPAERALLKKLPNVWRRVAVDHAPQACSVNQPPLTPLAGLPPDPRARPAWRG